MKLEEKEIYRAAVLILAAQIRSDELWGDDVLTTRTRYAVKLAYALETAMNKHHEEKEMM